MLGLCFFYVGYMFKKKNWKSYFEGKKHYFRNFKLMIILAFITVVLFFNQYHFWFFGGKYFNNVILSYVCAFSFMFFFVILTLMIKKQSKLILLISMNTIVIMGFDQYFRGYSKLIFKLTGIYPHMNIFIIFINACVIVLISTLIGMLLTRYVPVLVGQSKPKSK